jgi:hypothetical protein
VKSPAEAGLAITGRVASRVLPALLALLAWPDLQALSTALPESRASPELQA